MTTTSLSLSRTTAQYGSAVVARVRVNASGSSRDAGGSVSVSVAGTSRSDGLNGNGVASVRLPRLDTGNYAVRASYNPTCRFSASSDTAQLRIVKANARASVNVGSVERGDRPAAQVRVTTSTGVGASGNVVVRISKGGADYTRSDRLSNGHASLRFPQVRQVGTWTARVVYAGNGNIDGDSASDRFRVTRN